MKKFASLLFLVIMTYAGLSAQNSNTPKLLYEGDYTEGNWVNQINGWVLNSPTPHQHFSIYEDRLDSQFGTAWYRGETSNGRKIYESMWGDKTYYVDNNFNIYAVANLNGDSYRISYTKGSVSYNINTTEGNHQISNSGNNTYNNGNSNNGSNTTTQHKCGLCNGTGEVINNDATSFGNTKYCNKCGKTVPDSHYHTTCPSCKGKGWW